MTTILALWLIGAGQAADPSVLLEIQRSHIEANVPPAEDFNRFLQRDLEAYIRGRRGKSLRLKYEMLRDGPTQSGVAYPKFYIWIQAFDGTTLAEQGAVRVAAVERKQFQVTDFMTEASIRAAPASIYQVFPPPVCERIKTKLGFVK